MLSFLIFYGPIINGNELKISFREMLHIYIFQFIFRHILIINYQFQDEYCKILKYLLDNFQNKLFSFLIRSYYFINGKKYLLMMFFSSINYLNIMHKQ